MANSNGLNALSCGTGTPDMQLADEYCSVLSAHGDRRTASRSENQPVVVVGHNSAEVQSVVVTSSQGW